MRVFDNGSFFTVTASARDVADFASQWPCSGLCYRPLTMQYDKRNGDLVDSNDEKNHPGADGGAILALSHEMQFYGRRRLALQD